MKISRSRLADYVKALHQKACRTCSTVIFLHSTNQIVDLWRCRWLCRRQILNSRLASALMTAKTKWTSLNKKTKHELWLWSTLKPDWYARTYTVVCSSCNHNLHCGNFKLFFVVVTVVLFLSLCLFVCSFLWRTARNCSKVRAARAAQFSVHAQRTKQGLIIGAVISDPAVNANKHSYNIWYIRVRMLTTDTRFVF